jgi:hypothetical protein
LSSSGPFRAQTVFELHKAGGVPARPRQAIDETRTDWIGDHREYNRHGAGHLQQRTDGHAPSGENNIRRKRRQFRRVFANEVGISRAPSVIDPHVAAIGPAQLLHAL